jgi:hypothetical protein
MPLIVLFIFRPFSSSASSPPTSLLAAHKNKPRHTNRRTHPHSPQKPKKRGAKKEEKKRKKKNPTPRWLAIPSSPLPCRFAPRWWPPTTNPRAARDSIAPSGFCSRTRISSSSSSSSRHCPCRST